MANPREKTDRVVIIAEPNVHLSGVCLESASSACQAPVTEPYGLENFIFPGRGKHKVVDRRQLLHR
jgi:hypothetical protein